MLRVALVYQLGNRTGKESLSLSCVAPSRTCGACQTNPEREAPSRGRRRGGPSTHERRAMALAARRIPRRFAFREGPPRRRPRQTTSRDETNLRGWVARPSGKNSSGQAGAARHGNAPFALSWCSGCGKGESRACAGGEERTTWSDHDATRGAPMHDGERPRVPSGPGGDDDQRFRGFSRPPVAEKRNV